MCIRDRGGALQGVFAADVLPGTAGRLDVYKRQVLGIIGVILFVSGLVRNAKTKTA